jgi:hypothetical protein
VSKYLSTQLFDLVNNLTKAEKRNFKLYIHRNFNDKELITETLFDLIDNMEVYDEQKILKYFPSFKGNSLSNHKSNLYEQILSSLRVLYHNEPLLRLNELISFADILYKKGMYQQSILQLQKAKQLAEMQGFNVYKLEIIQLEKTIESNYISKLHGSRANELINESSNLLSAIYKENLWSDLSLKLYNYYIKFGHIKNEIEFQNVSEYFKNNLPDESQISNSFYCKLFRNQSYFWFTYIIQDFTQCFKYSKKLTELYDENPIIKENNPEMYMKVLHNSLSNLFFCDDAHRFKKELTELEKFIEIYKHHFNENQLVLAFTYLETAKINLFFLNGKYTEGAKYCNNFEQIFNSYKPKLDFHRILTFHYKMACLHFGSGNMKATIHNLNFIINHNDTSLREDIQCFARILNLISHFELGNQDLIYYQIKSTYRFLLKMRELQKVQFAIYKFLKNSSKVTSNQLINEFVSLKKELENIYEDKFEARPKLYLDIISWLESKIENTTVEKIIQAKKV